MKPSPIAQALLPKPTFADVSDAVVGLICTHLLAFAVGYGLHEYQMRRATRCDASQVTLEQLQSGRCNYEIPKPNKWKRG